MRAKAESCQPFDSGGSAGLRRRICKSGISEWVPRKSSYPCVSASICPSFLLIKPFLTPHFPHGVVNETHNKDVIKHVGETLGRPWQSTQRHGETAIQIGDIMPPAAWNVKRIAVFHVYFIAFY